MSFICHKCRRHGQSGDRPHLHTTKTRKKEYPSGAIGFEIVEEVPLCDSCWEKEAAA